MTREIYEAMKARISQVDCPSYYDEYPETDRSIPLWRFDSTGLNEDEDDDFAFDIIQPIKTRNVWNVAQRFYSLMNYNHRGFDERLLNH